MTHIIQYYIHSLEKNIQNNCLVHDNDSNNKKNERLSISYMTI